MRAKIVSALLLAGAALAACKSDEKPKETPPPQDLSLIEHTAAIADRMPDQRFRAQLFAELALADFTVNAEAARARVNVLLERGQNAALAVQAPDEQELALAKVSGALAKTGDFDKAVALAGKIHGSKPKSAALADIVDAAAKAEQFDRAGAIAASITEAEEKSAAWDSIAKELAESGDIEKALEAQRKCTVEEHANEALSAVSREFAHKKNLRSAEDVADKITSGHFRGEAYEAIARVYFEKGDRKTSDKMISRIESAWLQSRAYAGEARIARTRGQTTVEKQLADKAFATADGIGDKVVRASALEDLARLAVDDGDVQGGIDLANKAGSRDVKRKITAQAVAVLADAGRMDDATALAKSIAEDPLWGADALGAVAVARAGKGELDAALEVISTIVSLELRLAHLARVAVKAGTTTPTAASIKWVERILEATPVAPKT